jgi:hypothetical protein
MATTDSILTSVKKLLGLSEDDDSFDQDILIHINSAIFTLQQLGIGPDEIFEVTSKDETFEDYLGEKTKQYQSVRLYLYYKTRLGFDPPTSATVTDSLNANVAELEQRLMYQVKADKKKEV